jgi:hypothetical protein
MQDRPSLYPILSPSTVQLVALSFAQCDVDDHLRVSLPHEPLHHARLLRPLEAAVQEHITGASVDEQ